MSDETPPAIGRDAAVRGGAVLVTGDVAIKTLQVLTAVIVARSLDLEGFGTYSFAVAYAAFFLALADLGIDGVVTRELASAPAQEQGRIIATGAAVKGVVIAVATTVAAAGLLGVGAGLRVATALALVTLVGALPGTLALVLTARVQLAAVTAVRLSGAAATVVATVAALRLGGGPVAVVGSLSGVALLTSLALGRLGWSRLDGRLTVDRTLAPKLAMRAAPVAVSVLGMVIYRRVDQLLLGALGEVEELGVYSAAVRVVDSLNLLPAAVATVGLPVLARLAVGDDADRRGERAAATGYRLLAATILPVAALGTLVGGDILRVIFGDDYAGAGSTLAVLLWAHAFGFTGALLHQVLLVHHAVRPLAVLTVAGAFVNVGLDVWAIPRHGALGAAWASLLAYSVPFVGGLFVPAMHRHVVLLLRSVVRPALAALLVLAGLALVPTWELVIALFLPVSAVALLAVRATSVGEVAELVQSALPRSGGRSR